MEIAYYYFLALLATFLIIVSKQLLSKSFLKKLPPSPPFALPILGHLHLLKKPLHRCLSDLADRYGSILLLRFGSKPVLIVSSPSAVEECFTKNDIVFANRPRLLAGKIFGYNYTQLAWAPYGPHWRNLRRVSAIEILSSHRINMASDIHIDEIRSMVRNLLGKRSDLEFQKVELKQVFFELILNVLMRTIAGKRYCDQGDGKVEFQEARQFQEIIEETLKVWWGVEFLGIRPDFEMAGFWGSGKGDEEIA